MEGRYYFWMIYFEREIYFVENYLSQIFYLWKIILLYKGLDFLQFTHLRIKRFQIFGSLIFWGFLERVLKEDWRKKVDSFYSFCEGFCKTFLDSLLVDLSCWIVIQGTLICLIFDSVIEALFLRFLCSNIHFLPLYLIIAFMMMSG